MATGGGSPSRAENVDLLAFGELWSQFSLSLLRWQNGLGTAWLGREPEVKRPETGYSLQ